MLTRTRSTLSPELDALTHRIIGCALAVHTELGAGFLEPVYQKSLKVELHAQGLAFASEHPVHVRYRDQVIRGHRVDLIVENAVIVEIKAIKRFEDIHTSQLVSYLRATGLKVGLLVNFNTEHLRSGLRRVVL